MPADTIREEHLKHRQTENCKFCCKSGSSETSNSGPGTTLKRVATFDRCHVPAKSAEAFVSSFEAPKSSCRA